MPEERNMLKISEGSSFKWAETEFRWETIILPTAAAFILPDGPRSSDDEARRAALASTR